MCCQISVDATSLWNSTGMMEHRSVRGCSLIWYFDITSEQHSSPKSLIRFLTGLRSGDRKGHGTSSSVAGCWSPVSPGSILYCKVPLHHTNMLLAGNQTHVHNLLGTQSEMCKISQSRSVLDIVVQCSNVSSTSVLITKVTLKNVLIL